MESHEFTPLTLVKEKTKQQWKCVKNELMTPSLFDVVWELGEEVSNLHVHFDIARLCSLDDDTYHHYA